MASDYEPKPEPAGYSTKLVRSEFSSSRYPPRITMLPHLEINFRFICRYKLRRRPSLRISVRRNLLQLSSYNQTRESLAQVLRPLLAPVDEKEIRVIVEYALGRALKAVKARPVGLDVLDMYFTVSE
ncbi:hypoxanthine-guanine phosphoribosyltransferase [Striga asiatica]|uniref:Hypoxanthine-guanine phosphoribosyltransferase n=1 Tax=Striga asiatica TaxID=4170 RepID=A0A5A7P2D9_STRAF|nr:hypoxanthine-guanine phosphoribosyltransferase [Striga asiatica]